MKAVLLKDEEWLYYGEINVQNVKEFHGKGLIFWRKRKLFIESWFFHGKSIVRGHQFDATTLHSYKGEYFDNMKHGQGVYSWPTGDVYTGQFFKGMKEGFGIVRYSNGDVFAGQMKKDKREGLGEFAWKAGKRAVGSYNNDKMEGVHMLTDSKSKAIYKQVWSNNRLISEELYKA